MPRSFDLGADFVDRLLLSLLELKGASLKVRIEEIRLAMVERAIEGGADADEAASWADTVVEDLVGMLDGRSSRTQSH